MSVGPVNKLEEYVLAGLTSLVVLAMLSLPIQAVIECLLWLYSGAWSNYSLAELVPLDFLLWIYGDSSEWIGLRKLAGDFLQLWAAIPISIVGFIAAKFLNVLE